MREHESSGWTPTFALVGWATLLTLVALPRTIQAGDAGEFATIMLAGGVPHPPGYPWMRLLGLLARVLASLGVPPASAAALPPALAGVLAWAVLHRTCVLLGRPRTGALLIALASSAPLVLTHVPDSEVWGLHLLLCACFLREAARARITCTTEVGARRHAFRLGLWLGLAFSHHQTALFLLPLAIAAALPKPFSLVVAFRHAGCGLAGSLLGLGMLLTTMLGSAGAWRWGDTQSLAGWLHHVLRRDYGTASLSLHDEPVAATATVGRALASLAEVLSAGLVPHAALAALLLVMTAIGLRHVLREADGHARALAIGTLLSLLIASIGFASIQNIAPDSAPGAWILERFDLLPVLLWIPLLALVLGHAGERLLARASMSVRPRVLEAGALAIAIALLGAQLAALAERGVPAHDHAVEVAARDLVATPDPSGPILAGSDPDQPIRAIVLGTDDHRTFPVLYVQAVRGEGLHTLYVDASLFTQPWYRAWLRSRFPALPEVDKPLALVGALWSDPRTAGVPIYLANLFSRPAAEQTLRVPEGLLWRVMPPPDHPAHVAAAWTPEAIVERHLAACERMVARPADFPALGSERAAFAHPWSADLRYAYVEKAHALALALARAGRLELREQVGEALDARVGVSLP